MKIPRLVAVGLLSAFLIPSGLSAATAKVKVDPKALEILKRMSTTLAGAKAFTYRAKNIIEVPAQTGQYLTLYSTAEVALQRPNKLAARMTGEAPPFDFFYDGSTVTAFAPLTKVYSQTPAPSSIDEMLPDLKNETGIRFATTPLLMSDPYRALTRGLKSGVVVGQTKVGGVVSTHLAFIAPGVAWEIWVEDTAQALPRRLAVTFTDQEDLPRTIVEFSHWNLRPWLSARQFVFQKPEGVKEIPYASVRKSAGR